MGGDRDALGRITQSADALLSAGRDVYASGAGFQAIRGSVTGGLSALPVLQSYDAMMAGSLAAIQAAITAGTLNTSTTILPSGNIVQIAGGLQLGGVEAALAAIDAELAAGHGMQSANLGAANAHLYAANEIGLAQHASIVAAHASLVALHATQVAMHESIVALHATGTAAHATAVQMEGALYALGGIQMQGVTATATAAQIAVDVGAALGRHLAASNDLLAALAPRIDLAANDNRGGLAALATIAVDASAASAQGFAATNTILADSFAALGTIAADSNAALVTSIALSNTLAGKINADTGAARAYLSFIDNTLRALSNYTLDVRARLDAGNTLAADASANLVASFAALNTITADASQAATLSAAAMNTILVDSSAATVTSLALANTIAAGIHGDTMALRSYSAFIDNTLKAANNYAIEQTTELRGLRQQVNALIATVATLTGAVQQGAVLTATETRAVGVAVTAGADLVNDTLRRAA